MIAIAAPSRPMRATTIARCTARAALPWLTLFVLSGSCPAGAADSSKVLRIALPRAETGFDPAMASEVYSTAVIAAIMEPLLTFDYLARPVRVIPLTAAALPEITDDGRTYTFRIRPGIYFADDPAFHARRRELTANDYAYAIKRLVDPANRSPNAFHVAGKIDGLDEAASAAARPGAKFDYGARIAGLEVVDRHTLRIRLKRRDRTFTYVMALPALSAVAHEVIEAYPGSAAAHPVGTGPYLLKSWLPASKITLAANPGFRDMVWDFAPGDTPVDREVAAKMRGKKVPQAGIVEISVMEEQRAVWLAFLRDEIDIVGVPEGFAPAALHGEALAPELAKKGIQLSRMLEPMISYTAFNMRDPVIGGLALEKIALRRAIAMAYSNEEEIAVIRRGQAVPLQMPIPPGVAGNAPGYRSSIGHDPAAANRLLDRFGYRREGDGYRTLPDGKPLVIRYSSPTDAAARDYEQLWKKALDSIGIRLRIERGKYGDNIKAAIGCRHQMWSYGWFADYPDGDNFMQLLYGANVNQGNVACYASPAYDVLYAESRVLPDSPERTRLFERMARQFEGDSPWRLHVAAWRNVLAQPRVIGYKAHPALFAEWMYVDIDDKVR
jgi:oligopeptide transport system substrate-binding protein